MRLWNCNSPYDTCEALIDLPVSFYLVTAIILMIGDIWLGHT